MDCCSQLNDLLTADFFKALADPNRMTILGNLANCCGEPRTVSEITDALPVSVSVVSRHLGMLRDAGILQAEKDGRKVHYTVRYTALVQTLRNLADAIEACCPPDETADERNVK